MPVGVGIGAMAVGTGLQAYGQIKAGKAEEKAAIRRSEAAETQAQLDDFNAHVADLQAADAVERGDEAANRYRTQVRGVIGTTRTAQAAGNIDVSFGSASDVQADEAFIGKLDELTLRTNAAREAWGYNVQAANYRTHADLAREAGEADLEAGSSAATAGYIGAGASIALGASSMLGKKYGFGK